MNVAGYCGQNCHGVVAVGVMTTSLMAKAVIIIC